MVRIIGIKRRIQEINDSYVRDYVKRWVRISVKFPLIMSIVSVMIESIVNFSIDIWFVVFTGFMFSANVCLNTFALAKDFDASRGEEKELEEDVKWISTIGVILSWMAYAFLNRFRGTMEAFAVSWWIKALVLMATLIVLMVSIYAVVTKAIEIREKTYIGERDEKE